jgi:hypothetical protein
MLRMSANCPGNAPSLKKTMRGGINVTSEVTNNCRKGMQMSL